MKKLLTLLLSFVISLNLFITSVFAQDPATVEKVDVYALFWPVVPGTTVADSTFFLKQLKETFGGFFKSGNVSQSKYQLELSEKRLVEAAKLVENKDFSNALKSLEMNESNRAQVISLRQQARAENEDTTDLIPALIKSLENQQKALVFLASQFPQEQKADVEKMAEELALQISEAK